MRVLHVTEAMGGGVVSFLESIATAQTREGVAVDILYSRRADTPSTEELEKRFKSIGGRLIEIDRGSTLRNTLAIAQAIRAFRGKYNVIHLHSSIAGGVGRIVTSVKVTRLVYSPHGFAFLRLDKPYIVRTLTKMAEAMLLRRGALLVTSDSESRIACDVLGAMDAPVLRSGVPSSSIQLVSSARHVPRPRVIMMGRLVYQKAPWRFARVAGAVAPSAEFIWVGADRAQDVNGWMDGAPVSMRAWLKPEELEEFLRDTDILLFPSLWEGMSLALAQAQARGIPAVTSNVVGNRDAVLHGVTGFVCDTDDELIARTQELVNSYHLRAQMSSAALKWAASSLIDDEIGRDSISFYNTISK